MNSIAEKVKLIPGKKKIRIQLGFEPVRNTENQLEFG